MNPSDPEGKRRSKSCEASRRFFEELDTQVLAHELKGPLGVIDANLRLLLRPKPGEGLSGRQEKALYRSLRATSRVREIAYNLLEVGRSRLSKPCITEFGLVPSLIGVALESLEASRPAAANAPAPDAGPDQLISYLEQEGIFIEMQPPAERIVLSQDRTKFGIILGNLIRNAIRHRHARIDIRVAPEAGQALHITIADDGKGIDRQYYEALCACKGSTGLTVASDSPERHGLGLASALLLAHILGGDIHLEENRGAGGAAFRFEIPLAFDPA